MNVFRRDPASRFWKKVDRSGNCWLWLASKNWAGYGKFWNGSRVEGAHRFAWSATFGPIPVGMSVLHKCDNPACVNPEHLFLGNQHDNIRDMIAKGRRGYTGVPGERNPHAKLDRLQITEMRKRFALGETRAELARFYDVGWSTVDHTVHGRYWGSVLTESDRSSTCILLPEEY